MVELYLFNTISLLMQTDCFCLFVCFLKHFEVLEQVNMKTKCVPEV